MSLIKQAVNKELKKVISKSNLAVSKNGCIVPFEEIFHKRSNAAVVDLRRM